MSASILAAPCAHPQPAHRFQRVLAGMAARGCDIIRRLLSGVDHPALTPGAEPPAVYLVVNGLLRFTRALRWVEALAGVFAGTWHPAVRAPRAAPPAAAPPRQPRARQSKARRFATVTRAMRHAFATQPIGQSMIASVCTGPRPRPATHGSIL